MKFTEMTLWSGQLQETEAFYTEILGFALIEQGLEHFTIQAGTTLLTFRLAQENVSPFYHFALNIPENKFVEAKQWLAARVPLIREQGEDEVFFTSWNAHAVYFEDPSGNIVEWIARHHLPSGISHDFTVDDIMGVSEIGIVTSEVLPLVRRLNAAGIPNWRGDDEGLTPVGDEYGLLIVVRDRREWYFSNRKAAHFYPVELSAVGIGQLKFRAQDELLVTSFG
ncbi:Glyoxalase-like domain protein [compost metagenome]|uniref:VOC family protein n=1 Tax=Paenibacillus rhizolycopersici TaxID=2780073 RepID=A0ABS2H7E3_9BACL|nr:MULTISPECIES: VOC family protein [Paenibacillus]MBM6996671.1 VOC family protein [Paenibacillus rhizolycopersici]MUG88210.1 ring-cleaving dioxygenase [Paenibacillus timonensis]